MASVNNALSNIIHGRNNFCFLCFNSIEDKSMHLEDQILVDKTKDPVNAADVLFTIFGEVLDTMALGLGCICNQCKVMSINCYKFINECKENSHNLTRVIQSITESSEATIDSLNDYKSLFISLNTSDYCGRQYYDEGLQVTGRLDAFKRFNAINNASLLPIKRDPDQKKYSFISMIMGMKKEKRVRVGPKRRPIIYEIPSIPTADMLFNIENPLNYKCKVCQTTFVTEKKLRWHYFKMHYPRDFKCSRCTKQFISETFLIQHIDEHHGAVCRECGKSFINKYVLEKHEENHNLRIVCPDCGRAYRSTTAFRKHIIDNICQQKIRKKAEDGIYECNYCKKHYCYKPYLAKHIKYEHENATAHICEFCKKKFYTKSLLQIHMVKHTHEKNYECEYCGSKFGTKTTLLYHTRLHTGEKPYQCEYCVKAFLSASRRLEHMRRHHLAPSLNCPICNQIFKTTGALLKHKKRHSNPNSRLNFSMHQKHSTVNKFRSDIEIKSEVHARAQTEG